LKKRLRKAGCCCMLIPAFAIGGGLFWIAHLLRPVSDARKPIPVEIAHGSSPQTIASKLKDRNLIRSEWVFLYVAGRRGALLRMKPGRYYLSQNMTAADIVDRLRRGPADERTVTIPEGFTLKQIGDALAAKGMVKDRAEFLRVVKTRSGLRAPFPMPKTGLEGYLFPDTYRFSPGAKSQKIAQAMLDTFTKEFYNENRSEIERSGHTLHQIVTIASLIEREAQVPRDRPKIAGVIENRLKRKMRLQIDATIDYALGRHLTRVYYKDLEVKSPYNTYRVVGLPPGPIASPGKASLEAALHPERHDYLYYIAGAGGAHIFTRTEAEHNAVKARLRSARARPVVGGG
jgi:UPF0755 protein